VRVTLPKTPQRVNQSRTHYSCTHAKTRRTQRQTDNEAGAGDAVEYIDLAMMLSDDPM